MDGMVKTMPKPLGTLIAIRSDGIDKNSLIDMNDSGFTFDEIADYLDQANHSRNRK